MSNELKNLDLSKFIKVYREGPDSDASKSSSTWHPHDKDHDDDPLSSSDEDLNEFWKDLKEERTQVDFQGLYGKYRNLFGSSPGSSGGPR